MKKITRKFVIDYLDHLRNPMKYQAQAWYNFMMTDEAEAVSFACYDLGKKATHSDIPEIIQTAQLYLIEASNV